MLRGNIVILLAIVAFTAPPIVAADLPVIVDPLPKGAIASLGSTRFRYPFLPKSMLVSPDGQRLAVRGYVGIWVFDVATGQVIWREPYNGVYDGYCHAFAFSSTDTIVKCHIHADSSHSLTHYHIPSNRIESKTQLSTTHPYPTFSPDGTLFICTEPKTLIVNDVKSGKVLVRIPAPDLNRGHSIHFSPNNRSVVAVNSNGLILFYDRMLGGETGRIKRSSSPKHVQFSADGSSFLTIWDSILYCYDSLTGTLIHKIILKEQCEIFAMTPDGELFTLRSDKTGIDILNVTTNQYRPAISLSDVQPIHLAMTQNGKTLFAMTNFGGILVYDVATGKRLPQSVSTETESSFLYPYSLSFPGNSHDRIIERTRTWTVWDTSTGRRTTIPQPPDRTKIDLSRDGTKTLEVDKDTIQICDVASRAKVQQLSLRGHPELKHVAFSNDGTAVVGYSEYAIVSINITSGKVDIKQLPKTVKFEYPTYADDGRRIAVFQSLTIDGIMKWKLTIHDLNSQPSEWVVDQPLAGNTSPFAFCRNDSLLMVCSYVRSSNSDNHKQYVDCFDVSTRKLRHRISDLNAFAVSPDGRFVLSTLPEYSLSIIEVATGKVRMSFQYPKFDSIWNAEFSPDSQRLATKMYSGVLYYLGSYDPHVGLPCGICGIE